MVQAACRFPRPVTLTTGLLFILLILAPGGRSQAQALHELLGGSVGEIDSDEFSCFRPQGSEPKPCHLSYRYYCVDVPSEVNSPALPATGYARYKRRRKLYMADVLHTGNFPKATLLGAGHTWHLLWDGIKNPDTPNHIGYYAAMSQVVDIGEMGNPASRTCLPVVGQYACFGMMTAEHTNQAIGAPVGDLQPIGGLSPIPVPLLVRNGTDSVSFVWEQAAGQTSRDGAALPILGYRLYVYPNPITPPNEKQLQEASRPLKAILPADTTSFDLPRSDPALAAAVTLSAAIRVVYRGDLESAYFS
ncbi:MAG: hypothetical protein ACE5ID_09785, partial [Acidobacteriota bacterium]